MSGFISGRLAGSHFQLILEKNFASCNSDNNSDTAQLTKDDSVPCQKRKCLVILSGLILLAILVIAVVAVSISFHTVEHSPADGAGDNSLLGPPPPPVSDVDTMPQSVAQVYPSAAAASDSMPCATAAKHVLYEGGSAVDATIAALLCMGVYTPQSSGLGGGFLMTVYNRSTGEAEVIDARETAPAFASRDMFMDETVSFTGGMSIAVPGEARGLKLAHDRHGRLPWRRLFEDAIRLARNGFNVSRHMARALMYSKKKVDGSAALRQMFVNSKTGSVKVAGDWMEMPVLAATLEEIAKDPDALYTGALAEKLVKDIREAGGNVTLKDLREYKPLVKPAVNVSLSGGLSLFSVPPPGSGAILAFILKVLDGYGYNNNNNDSSSSRALDAVAYQRIVEAFKYGYGYRPYLGDDLYYNMTQYIDELLSPEQAEKTRRKIDDDKTYNVTHYTNVSTVFDHGTAHVSVVAPNGDAVSATATINFWFGSGVQSASTGIILNNEMDDFSSPKFHNVFGVPPSPSNFIRAGKRPMSSMNPAVIVNRDGDAELVIGAAGGTRITTATALVIARILFFGEDVKNATDAARFHHQLMPNQLEHEPRFNKTILRRLEEIGHELKQAGPFGSVVVGIQRRKQDGSLLANYDFRKGGSTDGF